MPEVMGRRRLTAVRPRLMTVVAIMGSLNAPILWAQMEPAPRSCSGIARAMIGGNGGHRTLLTLIVKNSPFVWAGFFLNGVSPPPPPIPKGGVWGGGGLLSESRARRAGQMKGVRCSS